MEIKRNPLLKPFKSDQRKIELQWKNCDKANECLNLVKDWCLSKTKRNNNSIKGGLKQHVPIPKSVK
jgi:hypothetical protein